MDPAGHHQEPITFAAEHGELALVQQLLTDGRVRPSGYINSAIHAAACNGHASVVRLLQAYPDVAVRDSRVVYPWADSVRWEGHVVAFRAAAGAGHERIVAALLGDETLLWQRSHLDKAGDAIRHAAEAGREAVMQVALADGRVPVDHRTLAAACRGGHLRIVDLLLTDPRVDPVDRSSPGDAGSARAGGGADDCDSAGDGIGIGDGGGKVLAYAAGAGRCDVVQRLLADPRINAAAQGNAALYRAVAFDRAGVAHLLLGVDAVRWSLAANHDDAPALDGFTLAEKVLQCLAGSPRPWELPLPTHAWPVALRTLDSWPLPPGACTGPAASTPAARQLRRLFVGYAVADAAWARRRAVVLARAAALAEE